MCVSNSFYLICIVMKKEDLIEFDKKIKEIFNYNPHIDLYINRFDITLDINEIEKIPQNINELVIGSYSLNPNYTFDINKFPIGSVELQLLKSKFNLDYLPDGLKILVLDNLEGNKYTLDDFCNLPISLEEITIHETRCISGLDDRRFNSIEELFSGYNDIRNYKYNYSNYNYGYLLYPDKN